MESMETIDNPKEQVPIYSRNSILAGTFLGGPFCTGLLLRRNYLNLGEPIKARNALLIGILSTVALFAVFFSLPAETVDKLPKLIVPAAYTALAAIWVERLMGKEFKARMDVDGGFYNHWRSLGVSVLCAALLVGGIFAYAYAVAPNFDADAYNEYLAEFTENEEEALEMFNWTNASDEDYVSFIHGTGIPEWEANLEILDKMDAIKELPKEFLDQDQILREYCLLRIESYELIAQSLSGSTNAYDDRIAELNSQIEELLMNLSSSN